MASSKYVKDKGDTNASSNNLGLRCLPLLLLAMAGNAIAFTPVAQKAGPLKTTGISPVLALRPYKTPSNTALSILWPGKDDTIEPEGKREPDSRLKLTGEASYIIEDKTLEDLVAPVSKVLDDVTGGWALSYANLEPENETTPIGITFLATNIAYGLAGTILMTQGNTILGVLMEIACFASFLYHFSQLKYGQSGSRIVRLALLVDYFFALSAIIVGSIQLFWSHQLPTEVIYSGSLAVVSLGACWAWEEGVTYIIFHSLWHLFSAYTGYVIGSTY